MANRFIKLLTYSLSTSELILLYGFSCDTEQEERAWRQQRTSRQCVWKAILSPKEADQFEKKLALPHNVVISDGISLLSPTLLIRPLVLSNDGHRQQSGPVRAFRQLIEFWNTHKAETLQQIEACIGCTGSTLYNEMIKLLVWVKDESGVDFISQGHRFGNFEHYQIPLFDVCFNIEYPRADLASVILRCPKPVDRELIVNCSSEYRGRWLNNQVQFLAIGETSLEFSANEPMKRIVVQAWDKETGDLVCSMDRSVCMGIGLNVRHNSMPYRVRDPWSEQLLQSASNRRETIIAKIETVSHSSPGVTNAIHHDTHNTIDESMQCGSSLFAEYAYDNASLGAFISNKSKDGEIDSYLKILEYIEAPSTQKVVIADPFFSVEAAKKMLCRISRTDVHIEIITTDGETNPDTGAKRNAKKEFEEFFQKSMPVIHKSLTFRILSRGNKHVFHDRYLIQYHADGTVRGYMLSNSLNSMGQFYPFVIAPLEHQVCLHVCDYLHSLCDPDIQSQIRSMERIQCTVLQPTPTPVTAVPLQTRCLPCLSPWNNSDGELVIPKDKLTVAVSAVMNDRGMSPEQKCHALCVISMADRDWTTRDLANAMRACNHAVETFLATFATEAAKGEQDESVYHSTRQLDEPIYLLQTLLKEQAQPNPSAWAHQIEHFNHIYYSQAMWLSGGYRLMLELAPLGYIALMETLCSPLMYSVLISPLMFGSNLHQALKALSSSEMPMLRLLAAECVFRRIHAGTLYDEQLKIIIQGITPEKQAYLSSYLLSQTKFHIRLPHRNQRTPEEWNELYQNLLFSTAEALSQCKNEERALIMPYLYECEGCSLCQLLLDLAERVKIDSLQKDLYQKAFDTMHQSLLQSHDRQDLSLHIPLYLRALEKRYGEKAEQEMLGDKKTISWSVFETATEPELESYNFAKWHPAHVRAQWQLALLLAYSECHPEAKKTAAWLQTWTTRLCTK